MAELQCGNRLGARWELNAFAAAKLTAYQAAEGHMEDQSSHDSVT